MKITVEITRGSIILILLISACFARTQHGNRRDIFFRNYRDHRQIMRNCFLNYHSNYRIVDSLRSKSSSYSRQVQLYSQGGKFSKDPDFDKEVEDLVETFSKKSRGKSSSLERYLQDGIDRLRENQLEESLLAFNNVVKIKPDTMLLQRGIVLHFLEEYESAKDQFINDRYLYEKATGRPGTEEAIWTAATMYKLYGQEKAQDLLMQANIKINKKFSDEQLNKEKESNDSGSGGNNTMNLDDLLESNLKELDNLNERIEMAINPAIEGEDNLINKNTENERDRSKYIPLSIVKYENRYMFRLLYDLFCGNLSPEYIIKAIQKNQEEHNDQGNYSLYGNFYLGLYFDALEMHDLASLHMAFATLSKKTREDDIMWSLPRIYIKKYGNGKFNIN